MGQEHWKPPKGQVLYFYCIFYFLIIFFLRVCLFLETGREGEREGEGVVASCVPPTGDLACNPGMCPDWESNWHPLVCTPALNSLSNTSQG